MAEDCDRRYCVNCGGELPRGGSSAWWFFLIIVLVLLMVAACSGGSPQGEFAKNQRLLSSCGKTPPASLVLIDGTGSSNSDAIVTERLAAVEAEARRTAVCSGYLRVVVFSATSASTAQLFDGELRMHGATSNARLKRVPEAVAGVMSTVREKYEAAVSGLPGGGSDIVGQYRLADEWAKQVGDGYRLRLLLLTDGLHNIGGKLAARAVDEDAATALAAQTDVPTLPNAVVVIAGLGRVAGTPPPSRVVEGLVAYYDALCGRTKAATCVSVTDYAAAGR